jgi:hypothetical protein
MLSSQCSAMLQLPLLLLMLHLPVMLTVAAASGRA